MKKIFTIQICGFLLYFLFCVSGNGVAAVGDVGVQTILAPASPVCKGNAPVVAIIQNFGGITISTATVNWSVNGISQTPFAFSGSITAGSQDTITLGSFNFTAGPDSLMAWTSDPNGSADSDPSNDTASAIINVSTSLTGTYTIGGTTPDFANFTAAVNSLIANGVCGPVIFNMRPLTDTMQIIIPQITGADSINTITFKSENGDSTSVLLTYPSLDTLANNYLIRLNGADYITFRSITLQRSGVNNNGRVLEFTNNSTHNTITNCRLLGVNGVTVNSLTALVYSSSGTTFNDSVNVFTNNLFRHGSLGIYMNGISSLNLEEYLVIKNNIFTDQYAKGVQMSNVGHAVIEGNTFTSVSTYSGYAAIYLDRSLRPHQIVKNKISGVPGTGIYLVDCTAQSGVHGVIANNFIHTNDSAGISMVNGDYQDIVFNSILMTGNTSTFSALLMRGSGTGKVVLNNVLSNTGGGFAYVVSDSAIFGISTSNYNNLFTTGSFVGNYNGTSRSNLAAWIAASSKDSNSVSVNPNFATISDLHCTSIAMDDRGTPYSAVTDDIDGETRSALTPDIGADEYASVSRNVGITALIAPADSTCGDTAVTVRVVVNNPGGFPESNFNVVAIISGAISDTLTQNHPAVLNAGTSDTLTFTTTINTSAGGTYNFKIYTSLSVDDVHANDTLIRVRNFFTPPAAPTGTGASICGAGSDTISASSANPINWYSASTGGSILATGATFITPFVNATTTYYAAASANCESVRTPVTLTVLPAANVNLGSDVSINQGDSTVLNAGAGFTAYLWSTSQASQTITVNSTGCYWVRVTNGFGCQDYDTVCVTVVQPFDVGVTLINPPSNNDCANDSIPVTVRIRNFGANAASGIPVSVDITGSATISFDDTITASIASGDDVDLNMGLLNGAAGGIYIITAYTTYINDLDNSNDTLINRDTLIVQPPQPTGIGGSRCGPGTIVLVSSSPDSVHWYDAPTGGNLVFTGDNYVLNNLASTVTYYAQAGQYCNNQDRTAVTGTINQFPAGFLGNDTTATDSIVLDAGPFFVSYQWNDFSTGQTFTATSTGFYSVCVTDTNGCAGCDTISISIVVGIDQLVSDIHVSIYPNPSNTSITVDLNRATNGRTTFTITDIQGREVIKEESSNVITKKFPVSHLAPGIYHLQVRTESGSSVHRLIIE